MSEEEEHRLRVQQLFVRHQGQLKAFALSLCPDFAIAEDVIQEVFLVISAKASEFEIGTNFLAWSKTIMRFKILEARRKWNRLQMDDDVLDSLAAACPEQWGENHKVLLLVNCLKQLPPRAREIVNLRYQKECTPTDIARLLDRTVNSINVALTKARKSLRDCLDRHLQQQVDL